MATTSTSTLTNLIQTAYDKYVEFNLRSEPMFRKFADKRPVDVTNPGATVVFQLHNDLSRVTSALTETVDVDAVALNNTNKVQVTVNEYGNAVTTTERLALESLSAIDPAVADMLSYNLRDSLDALVYGVLVNKATGRYAGTSADDEATVNGVDKTTAATTTLQAADVRRAVAKLRGANVQPRDGAFYVGMLHPDVSYDLRTEAAASGANVWREPHTYTEAGVGNIWSGEVGVYEGVKFIESARVEQAASATRSVTNKALTSNVATLTTSAAHGFEVGESVTVAGVDATFNGSHTITAVTSTTFSFAKTASNVTSAAVDPAGTASSLDHKVIIMGKQALLEAVTYEPKSVISPVTDKLMRFRSVGWKGLLGWNIYRPEARYVITCTSSI
jgi:N4-gp56 family major capsid protein